MTGTDVKNFQSPEETRPFAARGGSEVVHLDGRAVSRGTFEPGWRWSVDVKPLAGTESCQVRHLGYVVAGRMRVTMDDGSVGEVGPGDVVSIAPGHDAEVVGDESCVIVDFGDVGDYARRR
jgi:hypothetical protein